MFGFSTAVDGSKASTLASKHFYAQYVSSCGSGRSVCLLLFSLGFVKMCAAIKIPLLVEYVQCLGFYWQKNTNKLKSIVNMVKFLKMK